MRNNVIVKNRSSNKYWEAVKMTTAEKALQFMAEELKAVHHAKALVSAQLHDAKEQLAKLENEKKVLEEKLKKLEGTDEKQPEPNKGKH